ncbi:hypothetical protein WCP94_000839 [Bilophila wadsworthia]
MGVNALFSGNITHIQDARRNTLASLAVSQRRAVLPSTPFQRFRWAVR